MSGNAYFYRRAQNLFNFVAKNGTLGKGSKIKVGNFPLGEGGPENFENFSHFFLFIFKHGLNHPEMKRNFFSKVGTSWGSPT